MSKNLVSKKKKGAAAVATPEAPPATVRNGTNGTLHETNGHANGHSPTKKLSAKEKMRATLGLPPVVKADKKTRPKSPPGAIVPRKSKYNVQLVKGAEGPGWASSRVIHAMGAAGWEYEAARKALTHFAPATAEGISEGNFKARLAVGANPARSRPAPLSDEEWAALKKAAGKKWQPYEPPAK